MHNRLTEKGLAEAFSAFCIEDDLLLACFDGTAEEREIERIAGHLRVCESCSHRMNVIREALQQGFSEPVGPRESGMTGGAIEALKKGLRERRFQASLTLNQRLYEDEAISLDLYADDGSLLLSARETGTRRAVEGARVWIYEPGCPAFFFGLTNAEGVLRLDTEKRSLIGSGPFEVRLMWFEADQK